MNDKNELNELNPPVMDGYTKIPTFKLWVANRFPYMETDFDALTNYELLTALVDYLNNVIKNEENVESNVAKLNQAYLELFNYVKDYFNNLDVQEEINNKLDNLVADGTLTRLIGVYVQPLIDEQNQEIENFKLDVNSQINQQNAQIQAVESGSPLVASSVQDMTDTTRTYVNTSDGNWYYYNGSAWTIGGVYQATRISPTDPIIQDIYDRAVFRVEAEEKVAYDYTHLIHNSGSSAATPYLYINFLPLKFCRILTVQQSRATSNVRPITIFVIKEENGVLSIVKKVDYTPSEATDSPIIPIDYSIPNDGNKYYLGYYSEYNNIVSMNTAATNNTPYAKYNYDTSTETIGTRIETSTHFAIRAKVTIIQYTEHDFAEQDEVNEINANVEKNSNILNAPLNLLKTHALTNSADCTFVGNSIYFFSSGSDDHITREGYVGVYPFNFESLEIGTQSQSLRHNLGHVNSVSYNEEIDTLICGNGGQSYGTQGQIYILPNLSQKTYLDIADCIIINVNFGDKIQAFWGESNDGENNIIYVIANDNKFYAKLLLEKDNNGAFTGNYTVLESATTDEITDVNQGSTFYNGIIYHNFGHSTSKIAKCVLNNNTVYREIINENFYLSDGSLKTNTYGQGITIKNDIVIQACVDKVRIYKL